ncbi:MAG: indole-3-glycerol phosphate synthase TrpC, partial [Propionibacteriaceae bacterium]|nr:indole-3-glycerol phosphate synthase TrpC [Propionibacteriaceae bacterium]
MGATSHPTILDTLAAQARLRVSASRRVVDLDEMAQWARASDPPIDFPFERQLGSPQLSFICEAKKASPSKGLIAPDFDYLSIAHDYQTGGAAAISVLTEPTHFLGSDRCLAEIAASVDLPVLRKDFTVDDYQIFQARALGASAILLICAILTDDELRRFLDLADELGLSVLTETHDAAEIRRAVNAGARVIGVNNRSLHDFSVDSTTAERLRRLVPPDRLFVSESGVMSVDDAKAAAQMGADAVLVGEFLMRSRDRAGLLSQMRTATAGPAEPTLAAHDVAEQPARRRRVTRPPLVKICGLRREEDVAVINQALPTYVGLIFHPASRRHVDPTVARRLRGLLDPAVGVVGVFVDADIEHIADLARDKVISMIQLHGDEDARYVGDLRSRVPHLPIIKAVHASSADQTIADGDVGADFLLLDAATPGSGQRFDWGVIDEVRRSGRIRSPLFLAGGLDPGNVTEACRHGVFAVDVSSGVESDGHKDPAKVHAFMRAVRASATPGNGISLPQPASREDPT